MTFCLLLLTVYHPRNGSRQGAGEGCLLPDATLAPEKKRARGWWEWVPAIATHISPTNTVQPASEPVITFTLYQTELSKDLAGLGLPLLSFFFSLQAVHWQRHRHFCRFW